MKLILFLVLLSSTATLMAQDAIIWESEIVVSDGATYGNFRPRATLIGNTPVVVYGNTGMENVFVSRWNGSGFDTQSILPSGTSAYMAGWTGADIASKGDTVIATFKMNPTETGNVYIVRSIDGGMTFSDTIRANMYTGGNAWMPSMDIDANGNPVVSMMIHDNTWGNPRYVIAHSYDAGLTFNPVEEVAASVPGEACDCCPSEVLVDGDKQIMMFRNNDANIRDIYGVLSVDGGNTFPFFENVDNTNWSISACPSTGMDGVFSGDTLYSVFASAAEGIYRVYLTKNDVSSGLTFNMRSQVVVPDPSNGTQNYPTISGENDTLVMAWEERINFNKEIFYAVSVLGQDPMVALTSYKYQANDSTTGTQTNPEILYKDGFVHLFFQDDYSGNLIYKRGQIDVHVGLNEILSERVQISPNPSDQGRVVIQNAISVASVVNASGSSLNFQTQKKDNAIVLTIDSIPAGVYFISCTNQNDELATVKWIVTK